MNIVYFDLETQKIFEEVGGRDASKLLLACGVTWSTERNDFAVYWEKDAPALIAELKSADRVIGFNIINFDYEVLKPYAPNENFRSISFDGYVTGYFPHVEFPPQPGFHCQGNVGCDKNCRWIAISGVVQKRGIG